MTVKFYKHRGPGENGETSVWTDCSDVEQFLTEFGQAIDIYFDNRNTYHNSDSAYDMDYIMVNFFPLMMTLNTGYFIPFPRVADMGSGIYCGSKSPGEYTEMTSISDIDRVNLIDHWGSDPNK